MAQISAGQDGIQKLLAAEKEAQEIVAKARKGAGLCSAHYDTAASPAVCGICSELSNW